MPPLTPAPAPPCDHCGYDLTGIAPEDAASPQTLKCPECGKRTDICKVPRPSPPWWRSPLAVLAGAGVILAIQMVVVTVDRAIRGRSLQSVDPFGTLLIVSISVGGAISMMITWRDFLAYQRWFAQEEGTPLRSHGPLLVEFFVYCIVNSIVAGLVAVVALVLGLR